MTVYRRALWWLWLAGGCRGTPLWGVPIEGGTPEQRAAAIQAMEDFELWAGRDRVRLRKVVFVERVSEWAGGQYRTFGRVVRLQDGQTPEQTYGTMQHELCHALDYQQNLLNAPHDVFDALAEEVRRQDDRFDMDYSTKRSRRGEVYARVCTFGPAVADAMARPCPGDDPLLAEAAAFVKERVWRGRSPLIGTAVAGEVVSWTAPEGFSEGPWEHLEVLGYYDALQVRPLDPKLTPSGDWVALAVEDGERVTRFPPDHVLHAKTSVLTTHRPPYGLPSDPEGSTLLYPSGATTQGTTAYLTPRLQVGAPRLGRALSAHWVWLRDARGRWASDACPRPDVDAGGRMKGSMVAVGPRLYAVWTAGDTLHWQSVTPLLGEAPEPPGPTAPVPEDTAVMRIARTGEAEVAEGWSGRQTVSYRGLAQGRLCELSAATVDWDRAAVVDEAGLPVPNPLVARDPGPCTDGDGNPCAFAFAVVPLANDTLREGAPGDCAALGIGASSLGAQGSPSTIGYIDDYRVGGVSYGPMQMTIYARYSGRTAYSAWFPHTRAQTWQEQYAVAYGGALSFDGQRFTYGELSSLRYYVP